jgi:ribonuclease H2 subunit B
LPLSLIHPANGKECSFLLSPSALLELNWNKSEYTSWLSDDSVIEDGGVYAATPVDTLFLALPMLLRERGKGFCSLETLLESETENRGLARLQQLLEPSLPCVCAVQTVGDERYYRLDDARTLAWLSLKASNLAAVLRDGGAAGAAFEALSQEELLSYSVELLGEYVVAPWLAQLRSKLQLPERCAAPAPAEASMLPQAAPTQQHHEGPAEAKKAKLSSAAKAAQTRVESNTKANAKAAQGTASLASFFGGGAKKKT